MISKKFQAVSQLTILIVSIFAFAFFIAPENENASGGIIAGIIKKLFEPIIPFVSAISVPSVCCEKTTSGANCLNTNQSACDTSINPKTNNSYRVSPTSCESTAYCKQGTCYNSKEGICMENTPQITCNANNGTWDERAAADVPQCQLGCCIIADQAAFVPLVRCKRLSSFFGVAFDYRKDITSEVQCIATAQGQDTGACVYSQDFSTTCKFTTRKDCNAQEGVIALANSTNTTGISTVDKKFYKDYLCSAEELGTDCARETKTICYGGMVYWADSCGNRENVYSSNKDLSWNKGRVAIPNKICSPNDGSSKDCGNCDYLLGSRCGLYQKGILNFGQPSYGDYYCKKTDCVGSDGTKYKNGESWCVYDTSAGNGTDPVGSRHYRDVCVDGTIQVEPCADFRQQVCIQGSINSSDGNFKTAACRVNRWQDCINQMRDTDCSNTDKRDCKWLNRVPGLNIGADSSGGFSNPAGSFSNPTSTNSISGTATNPTTTSTTTTSTSTGFTNPTTGKAIAPITGDATSDSKTTTTEKTKSNRPGGVCVPDIPPGLQFWKDGDAQSVCGLATGKCIVTFEEGKLTGKKCIDNCQCLEESWALAMNSVCMSLGDCGGKVNYVGKYTDDGYEWKVNGKTKKFSASSVNAITKSGSSKSGSKSSSLSFGTVAGVTAGLGVLGMIMSKVGGATPVPGFGAVATGETMIPNLMEMFSGAAGKAGVGNGLSSLTSSMNSNWLAAGAFNALLIGGIVYMGAKMFGSSSSQANALGSAATIGLFAGSAAGHLAASAGSLDYITYLDKSGGVSLLSEEGKTLVNPDAFVKLTSDANLPTEGVKEGATKILSAGDNINANFIYQDGAWKLQGLQDTSSFWVQNAGLINLGVTILVAVLVYMYLNKKTTTQVVTYTCMPWQAPLGSSDCEKCNDDMKPCSEYRCKSLGGSCSLINAGTTKERCVSVSRNDVSPPVITPDSSKLTSGYKYTNIVNSPPSPGFKIINTNGTNQCLKAFTPLKFGVTTDEPAQCKIDFNHTTKMDDMQFWFGGNNLYEYNHTELLILPGTKDIADLNASGIVLENGKDLSLFLRCRDANGNENEAEYAVKMCTDPSPDSTAPEIKATSIISGGCVAQGQNTSSVDFYVNEPSQCRWSKDDKSYEQMENNMLCSTNVYELNALNLYACTANLTGVTIDGKDYYVRCEDQQDKPASDRNRNQQSYKFSLRGSNALKIKDPEPNGTIYGSTNPAEALLSVDSLYGCDNGKAICYYSRTGNDNDFIAFFNTNNADGTNTQKQDLSAGSYTYYFKCIDSGGNVARTNVTFTMDIDTNAPVIARAYQESDKLKIVTVRDSECSYSFDNCDFTVAEGTEMPQSNSTIHVADWKTDKTYYIKCMDQYKNEPADCSMIVVPYKQY